MTVALCIFCGEWKIGAFSVCPKCDHPLSGDEGLDSFFTDWHCPKEILEHLGNVSKALKVQNKDPIPVFREIMLQCRNDDSVDSDHEA